MKKQNKLSVGKAKLQIRLGIGPVCSASSLWAQWVEENTSFFPADSKDSDQMIRSKGDV